MKRLKNWKFVYEGAGDWSIEWWDGRGLYICSDFIRWWQIPYNVYIIWKEQIP